METKVKRLDDRSARLGAQFHQVKEMSRIPEQVNMHQLSILVADILERLSALADPAKARQMRDYLRGQFDFLGLPAAVRRAAVHDLVRAPVTDAADLIAIAAQLWALPQREFKYTAVDLLQRHFRLLEQQHLPALQDLLRQQAWW